MSPMEQRWWLAAAMPGRPLGRFRTLPLRLQRFRTPSHDCRLLSVLLDPSDRRTTADKERIRALVLHRVMSTTPPNDSDQQKKQHELEAKTAARILKQKLKKDMETARSLAMHQVVNVPNVITAARILATPYLAHLIIQGDYVSAIGLLAVAGVSDWLDGFIARTFHQESIVGSFLDPFADKLLIGTLSLSMMWTGLLPLPLAALILGRDGMLIGGTFYHRLKTKDESSGFFDTSDSGAFQVKPSMLSKVNTALQLSAFGLTLTNAAWQIPPDPALSLLFGVVGTTTFLSGSEYLPSQKLLSGHFAKQWSEQKPL
ncbi:cardiolipin synthetase, putative [Phytophthora infestans T30-4]|uniref:Cardiolipin synthetase, putative n=1 Tax=Phytophthora infestans (strain T30-4) TaxID=403677 RepID=D0NUN6_PHYIT|nr:cardiolipin synthetase, putative [Phytophthora infestans T30-4]EEY65382.1 cardiolipin synthetase, putative [Phytophthora infestans T30-4]|eukprot:XP_002897245.1 cardiolipin synthetase, putative [Phytophthora infestans T30-4]